MMFLWFVIFSGGAVWLFRKAAKATNRASRWRFRIASALPGVMAFGIAAGVFFPPNQKVSSPPEKTPNAQRPVCGPDAETRVKWLNRKDEKWGYGDGSQYSPAERGGYRAVGDCYKTITSREFDCDDHGSIAEANRDNPYYAEAAMLGFTTLGCIKANLNDDNTIANHIDLASIVSPAVYADKDVTKKLAPIAVPVDEKAKYFEVKTRNVNGSRALLVVRYSLEPTEYVDWEFNCKARTARAVAKGKFRTDLHLTGDEFAAITDGSATASLWQRACKRQH